MFDVFLGFSITSKEIRKNSIIIGKRLFIEAVKFFKKKLATDIVFASKNYASCLDSHFDGSPLDKGNQISVNTEILSTQNYSEGGV